MSVMSPDEFFSCQPEAPPADPRGQVSLQLWALWEGLREQDLPAGAPNVPYQRAVLQVRPLRTELQVGVRAEET